MFKNTDKLTWILFALVIVALYLFALDLPLLGPDEPRYSQVGREMFERNDWVTTTLGGYNWFEKPALLYWLQIVFYSIFGVTEFAARFGSALFGLGTILSLWLLGRNVQTPKSNFANWLMLIAASSLGLIVFSRGASFDIMITFPICASLVSFFIWETKSENQSKSSYLSLTLFYFFIGVAVIAKGLIGVVFPFAIVSFYYVLRLTTPNKTFLISLVWGTILSILVASTWYLPMYLTNGWEFIDEFFIQHHFQRFASNKYKHPQPFWFFWLVLPAMTIPWIPFFFASIWNFINRLFNRKDADSQREKRNLTTFALAWLLVPLVFFSISGSKLPGYILPALPAACILTAIYVYKFVQKSVARKYVLQGLAFLTFAVILILLRFVVPDFAKQDSTKHFVQVANENGYDKEQIVQFHTINHNIEFYGNGRLVRDTEGKLRRFNGVSDIADYLKNENKQSVLVIVPHEFLSHLIESDLISANVLDKNAELEFVAVKLK